MVSEKKGFWIYSESVELGNRVLPHLRDQDRNQLQRGLVHGAAPFPQVKGDQRFLSVRILALPDGHVRVFDRVRIRKSEDASWERPEN